MPNEQGNANANAHAGAVGLRCGRPRNAQDWAVNADGDGGGKWRAVATVHEGRNGGGSRPVQRGEAEANARLIAAAPDLLAALEEVTPEQYGCNRRVGRHALITDPDCPACQMAERHRALIRKAKGGDS